MSDILYANYKLGSVTLNNRIVMAPMTRCRAINNVPNDLMAEYYRQRSGAGLIITEGTSPSPNGLGYARIPGLFNAEQVAGWKKVTTAVHKQGAKIFVQLMHTGRVSHSLNMPAGAKILAPSAIGLKGSVWTDQQQMQPYEMPAEMTLDEIESTIEEYVQSARLAVEAGFDGVELHAANGYLLEQFINPTANQRTDIYGGSAENRIRFVLEVARRTVLAIGADKVGIRVSPYGVASEMGVYDGITDTYALLALELSKLGLVYMHVVDHSGMGAPKVPDLVKETIRTNFSNTVILAGSYTAETAERDLTTQKADLIAFGRPFISNPSLPEKLKSGAELVAADHTTFYSADSVGYTDYQ